MNIERISFRTNESERQFLHRLNQHYKCKDNTSLMHRVLQDFEKQSDPSKNQYPLVEVFGDLGKPSISETIGVNKDEHLRQKFEALFPDFMSPAMRAVPTRAPDAEERYGPRLDAMELITDQLAKLERYREIHNRSLPPGYRPL